MNRTYSLVLRVYTPKLEEVRDRAERALAHVRQFLSVAEEFPMLKSMVIVTPEEYDCGQTQTAISLSLIREGLHDKVVTCMPAGHHSCHALNVGCAVAQQNVSHALIVSGKAMSYLTPSALRCIDQAFFKGAKVSGLAIDELRDIVLGGCIQNTFAAWDIDALAKVGGFDSSTGVEEVAPLVRLTREYGACIAPIDTGIIGKLDIHVSETARARHQEVMNTKIVRQLAELKRVNAEFSDFVRGIMPSYPRAIL